MRGRFRRFQVIGPSAAGMGQGEGASAGAGTIEAACCRSANIPELPTTVSPQRLAAIGAHHPPRPARGCRTSLFKEPIEGRGTPKRSINFYRSLSASPRSPRPPWPRLLSRRPGGLTKSASGFPAQAAISVRACRSPLTVAFIPASPCLQIRSCRGPPGRWARNRRRKLEAKPQTTPRPLRRL